MRRLLVLRVYAARRLLGRFRRDERGSLVMWFGLGLIPLLFVVGTGLDYGRGVNLKTQLQGAADAAALAGASVYVDPGSAAAATATASTYMDNFVTAMGPGSGIGYSVQTSATSAGGAPGAYSVTVRASGTIATSLMRLSAPTITASVSATAGNPAYTLTLTLSHYSSSAGDANLVSYYVVPQGGGVPAAGATTPFFTNNGPNSTAPIVLTLTASQKLGFRLENVTGARSGNYGSNGYGGAYLSTHDFYSHLAPPSSVAYPFVPQNCSLQVTATAAAVTTGTCSSGMPANASINCAAMAGATLVFSWNDMGGASDDRDYNDMVYTVRCSQNDPTLGQGVVLTN